MEVLRREVKLENGSRVFLTAGPRYPYWVISFERGEVPAELKGMFQYYDDAIAKLDTYLSRRQKNKTNVKRDKDG